MILHCHTSIHPLIHPGTQQRERLLKALIPGNLKLDDRSLAELLSFAGKLAKHIRYWNDEDREAGDWTAFWKSDLTSLLAIIASTDIESARVMFRSKQLEYFKLKKREDAGTKKETDKSSASVIIELVSDPSFGIYGLALKILEICKQSPETHPIKKDIISIIETKLQQSFYRLIQFHKAVEQNAIAKYKDFIGTASCSAPWNIKTNPEFECIDFVMPYEYFEELWKLFLKFLQALNMILEKAKRAFNSSLRSRSDHQPHITLFLAFLHLFRYLQSDLNNLTEKHLLFYYQDVLRLQQRGLIPDKVHIVFEIAENLERYRIKQGTLLPGGVDATGKPLFYSLQDELVAGKAKLVERKNYYFYEDKIKNEIFAFLLPAADMRDGIEEPFEEPEKLWHPLSGHPVFKRFNYKYEHTQNLVERAIRKDIPVPSILSKEIKLVTEKLDKLKGISGFTISTPELWMEKNGLRFLYIEFDITVGNAPIDIMKSLLDDYIVEISTAEGLITLQVEPGTLSGESAISNGIIAPGLLELSAKLAGINSPNPVSGPKDPQFKSNNRIQKVDDEQIYVAVFDHIFPGITPVDQKTPPFIRFRAKNHQRPEGKINFIGVSTLSILGFFAPRFSGIELPHTLHRVSGGQYETGKRFFITAVNGEENIVVRFPELFGKDLQFLTVKSNGFTVTGSFLLNEGQWKPIANDGTIPGYVYKEKGDGHFVPETFDFKDLRTNRDGWIRLEINTNQLPVVVDANTLKIDYWTNNENNTRRLRIPVENNANRLPELHTIHLFTSLGEWIPQQDSSIGFRPTPELEQPVRLQTLSDKLFKVQPPALPANGNLFLGFENLVPSQTLSLLYKTAEGTGNADYFAPDIIWSYLKDNEWIQFPAQFILIDETLGLKQTGIIRFQIPSDINNGNTRIKGKEDRTDLYWLRASATEIPADLVRVRALPMLRDIYVNAATAVFEDDDNSTEHLVEGIPEMTISSLRFRDVNVKTVLQPYRSFDGRLSEKGDVLSYYQRINERLRHKQRAVTIWDYERLTLEKFPEVALAKCLSHTRRFAVVTPGHVTMAVIPFPDKMIGTRKYYPGFDTGKLEAIRDFLVRYNSLFVGGYGDAEFCCCEDGCECEKPHRRLVVINPRFEPVRLKVCVRFIEGKDIPFYTKELNEALKNFLAPWAKDSKSLMFGIPITLTSLLKFLENLDYVDVVLNLEVKHFASKESADENENEILWSKPDHITPFTSASILTTYLDRLNEDNPNVIDHEINVVEKHDRCLCGSCDEETTEEEDTHIADTMSNEEIEELKTIIETMWRNKPDTNAAIKEFQAKLNEYADWGLLKGAKIGDPSAGEEGKHAYKIEKIKPGSRIEALKISIADKQAGPFTTFTINNPHLNT